MYTKNDLIKLGSGSYKLPTATGVWTIGQVNSHKWGATTEHLDTVTAKTLTQLIVTIDQYEQRLFDSADDNNADGCIVYDYYDSYEDEIETDETQPEPQTMTVTPTATMEFVRNVRSDYVDHYSPINFGDSVRDILFATLKYVETALNFIIDNQVLQIITAVVLAYLATFLAPFAYNGMKVTMLTVLPIMFACAKLCVLVAPFIAMHIYQQRSFQLIKLV